jgi:HEAT repeat protein
VLKRAIDSNNVNAMEGAVAALARLDADEAGDLVLKALKHSASSVRVGALDAAAQMKLKVAYKRVAALLTDPEADIRATACITLKVLNSGDDELHTQLFKRLQDKEPVTRAACSEAFAAVAPKAIWLKRIANLLLSTRSATRLGAIRVLGQWRDDSMFDLLLGRTRDSDARVRAVAVSAVAHYQRADVIRELRSHMDDEDADVRIEAVAGLAKHAKDGVQGALIQALYDEDAGVRAEAVGQLLRFASDPNVALKIIEFIGDKSPGVREAVALSLVRLADPRTLKAILARLPIEENESVRIGLVQAAASADPVAALPHLVKRLGQAKGRETGAVAGALAQITGQELGLKPAPWSQWLKSQRD